MVPQRSLLSIFLKALFPFSWQRPGLKRFLSDNGCFHPTSPLSYLSQFGIGSHMCGDTPEEPWAGPRAWCSSGSLAKGDQHPQTLIELSGPQGFPSCLFQRLCFPFCCPKFCNAFKWCNRLCWLQFKPTKHRGSPWFQTAPNQMSLWLSFQIHSLRRSTFSGISLLFISSLCFISAFMSPSEDSKEQDSLFSSCRHERYLRTKNLREVLPKKSETLDVPSFLPGGAKEAPQSLGTPSSPACDWYRRVCVLLSCPEMKQHLGHFHFPMEGKNKIKHKAQPCTGGRELFQQAGAQGHYTWGWRKQSQSCPGKGIGNHA